MTCSVLHVWLVVERGFKSSDSRAYPGIIMDNLKLTIRHEVTTLYSLPFYLERFLLKRPFLSLLSILYSTFILPHNGILLHHLVHSTPPRPQYQTALSLSLTQHMIAFSGLLKGLCVLFLCELHYLNRRRHKF